ncbi:hypothetical protein [Pseudomonas sp. PDM31]|uniref:hypothetical protein n=1 Tax=Pseudomonas sp. PDM31 TaxID=2854778 RepID=UPI00210E8136|nr:hypothetical protein [Pseudomonas sp. PDM31]
MKNPAICTIGGLLLSMEAFATGIMPVFDMDFTRSATETLKKIGIHDACIIKAANPTAFTYCREGSTTLWQYQALDLEQLDKVHGDAPQSSKAYLPISVKEVDSVACLDEHETSSAVQVMSHWFALVVFILSLLVGVHQTLRVIQHRRNNPTGFSPPHLHGTSPSLPGFDTLATTKALAAFTLAVTVAIVYFSYTGF